MQNIIEIKSEMEVQNEFDERINENSQGVYEVIETDSEDETSGSELDEEDLTSDDEFEFTFLWISLNFM